jgi:hypothetical protein
MYRELTEDILDEYRYKGNRLFTILKLSALIISTAIISLLVSRVFSEEEPLKKVLLGLTALVSIEHVFIIMRGHKFNKQYIKAAEDQDKALYAARR